MRKRGTAITNLDFDGVRDIDKQLTDLVNHDANYDELTRPVCAFITFESDDGYNAALSYTIKKKWYQREEENDPDGPIQRTIFNEVPYFKAATEPTNIIWENRHIKGLSLGVRVTAAVLVSVFMLLISFGMIIYFKQTAIKYS